MFKTTQDTKQYKLFFIHIGALFLQFQFQIQINFLFQPFNQLLYETGHLQKFESHSYGKP